MVSVRDFPPARARGSWCARPGVGVVCEKSEISFSFIIVLIALAQYDLDASMLSLDNVYKGLNRDLETYYFLWVAVRKVLGEAPPNVMLDLFKIFVVPVGKNELMDGHMTS
jgi:hypothetical protein